MRQMFLACVAAAATFLGGCHHESPSTSAAAAQPARAPTLAEALLRVEGMHCATCPVTVRMAAKRVAGVADARVNLEQGKAWVTYDPSHTHPAKIAAAITESGYRATLFESRRRNR